MMSLVQVLKKALLESDVSGRGWLWRTTVFWIRMLYSILLRFMDSRLHLLSTSLAYTTLLSLVPLLAVTFSVLKGFGVQNQIEPMLMQALEPLGSKGAEIGETILNYVNNLNFAVLGFFGIALLFWTVLSLLQKVEEAFNSIWNVPSVRSLARRFSDYLSVTLVGPVLIVTALGLATIVLNSESVRQVTAIEPFGRVLHLFGLLMPNLLICFAFAFLYSFLTNTRVRMVAALVGGLFAGFGWYGVGHLFADLVANSSRYSAVYSSLAAVVLFFIWVNVGWLIILVGAHIARHWQNPGLLQHVGGQSGYRAGGREELALGIMALIGRAHYFGELKWTREDLAARGCCGSLDEVEELVRSLKEQGLVVETREDPPAILPGRAMNRILISEITAAARSRGQAANPLPAVEGLLERIEAAISDTLGQTSLADLVLAQGGASPSESRSKEEIQC